jgi:hypothetical protein
MLNGALLLNSSDQSLTSITHLQLLCCALDISGTISSSADGEDEGYAAVIGIRGTMHGCTIATHEREAHIIDVHSKAVCVSSSHRQLHFLVECNPRRMQSMEGHWDRHL